MTSRVITKQLAGQEDILFGEGTETQSRAGLNYTVNKNRVIYPCNSTAERDALDPNRFPKCAVFVDGVVQFYNYDFGNSLWVEALSGPTNNAVEQFSLTSGQTTLITTRNLQYSAVYITGDGADNGRIFSPVDYTVDYATNTITLANSYPEGTLVNIVITTIQADDDLSEVIVLDTIALAKTQNLQIGRRVKTNGYYASGDGGHGNYIVVANDTGTDDGGSYHDMANGNQLELVSNGTVDVRQFGSTSDPDISTALNAAAAFASEIIISYSTITLNNVNVQGKKLIGQKTTINDTSTVSNIGKLEGFIVRGYSTDEEYTTELSQAGNHKKIVSRESSQRLAITMKRRGKGYVRVEHYYNSYTSGSGDTGGSCENWRSAVTSWLSEVYLYKHAADFETGSAWAASANMGYSVAFPSGTVSGDQVQYRATNTLNAEIAWDIESRKVGQVGYVAVYATGGSSNTNELYIDGVLQTTFSAVKTTQDILLIKYETTAVGTVEVRLKKTAGGSLNVIGAEFTTLEDLDESWRANDTISYGDYDKDYVPGGGAQDYAFYSVGTSKFFGSIHGGETQRVAPELFLDGDSTTIPAIAGDYVIGDIVKLFQRTTIASTGSDSMDVASTYTYYADGYQKFDCAMEGSCNVSIAYTSMTPTNEDFGATSWPLEGDLDPFKNTFGRYNAISQQNNTTKQRLTTKCTLFPCGGVNGANMGANGPYISLESGKFAKFYYGPVLDSPTTLTKLSYTTERLYE